MTMGRLEPFTTQDGIQIVASDKTDATKATFFSHDWTDPTTWYTDAVRVVDEVPTPNGAFTVYTLDHQNAIDTYHGKVFGEDYLVDADTHSYRVVVKVDNVVKTEQDPHTGSGGDFTVDYEDGTITFLAALDVNKVVEVTYHYAQSSLFVVAPLPGTRLRISFVECQFSTDMILNDTAQFTLYGLVDVFAPQMVGNGQGQVPSGTKIPLAPPLNYKSVTDFQAEAVRSYVQYPAFGGAGWRGAAQPILVLDWDYASVTELRADLGLEIHVRLQHDVPFGGWYATTTFYGTSYPL